MVFVDRDINYSNLLLNSCYVINNKIILQTKYGLFISLYIVTVLLLGKESNNVGT